MRSHLTYGLILFAALLGSTSCDTARNMESPLEKYFLKYVGTDGDQEGVDMVVSTITDTADPLYGAIFLLGNTTNTTLPNDASQLYVTRMTAAGIVVWDIVLGDVNIDEAKDIELLDDQRTLAILGSVTDNSTLKRDFRIWLLNPDGTIINSVTYGNPLFNDDAISISETTNSFLVSGSTDVSAGAANPSDAFVVRLNKDLTAYSGAWTSPDLGGLSNLDVAVKTLEVNNDFYVFGYWDQEVAPDPVRDLNTFIWVLNDTGVPRKQALTIDDVVLRGTEVDADDILSSVVAAPGGFLLSGSSVSPGGNTQNIFSMKVWGDILTVADPSDAVQYALLDSESQSTTATLHTSAFASQGSGFFVLGCESNDGHENIYLKKLTREFTDAWIPTSFIFGGIGNDVPGAVAEAPDGGVLILGTMVLGNVDGQKKMVLIKLQPDGRLGE